MRSEAHSTKSALEDKLTATKRTTSVSQMRGVVRRLMVGTMGDAMESMKENWMRSEAHSTKSALEDKLIEARQNAGGLSNTLQTARAQQAEITSAAEKERERAETAEEQLTDMQEAQETAQAELRHCQDQLRKAQTELPGATEEADARLAARKERREKEYLRVLREQQGCQSPGSTMHGDTTVPGTPATPTTNADDCLAQCSGMPDLPKTPPVLEASEAPEVLVLGRRISDVA